MAKDVVDRWYPKAALAERPATLFDLNWQGGQQRLIVTLRLFDPSGLDDDDCLIVFHNVFAYCVFDEHMDDEKWIRDPKSGLDPKSLDDSWPKPIGCWPFLEISSSQWLDVLAERHGGWTTSDFRHFIVATHNMNLHVASRNLVPPTYIEGSG